MGYYIVSRCHAVLVNALDTDEQLCRFDEYCDEKLDMVNGEPDEFGVSRSEFYATPKGKRLFIEFRKDWSVTDNDKLFDGGAYPKCTLVIIVPGTAGPPPHKIQNKMVAYEKMVFQKPAKATLSTEDFELIEDFRLTAECIRNTSPNMKQMGTPSTGAAAKPKKKRARKGSKYENRCPAFFQLLLSDLEKNLRETDDDEGRKENDFTLEKALSLTQKEAAEMLRKAYPDEFKTNTNIDSIASGIKKQKTAWRDWRSSLAQICGDMLTPTTKDSVDFDSETGHVVNTQRKNLRADLFDAVVIDFFGEIHERCLNEGCSNDEYRQEVNGITALKVAQWAKRNRKKYDDPLSILLLKWDNSSITCEIEKCNEWKNRKQSLDIDSSVDRGGD